MSKKRILGMAIAVVALVFCCALGGVQLFAAEENTSLESRGEIDVYLIAGQSNAVGFGSDGLSASILNDPRYTDGFENVLYYGVGENNVVSELVPVKTGLGKNTDSVGAEIGIAAAVGNSDRNSAVIKHAIGGSYLYPTTDGTPAQNYGTWTPPSYIEKYGVNTEGNKMGDIYEEFVKTVTNGIALLRAEGYTPVVKGFWWMQGEAETPYEAPAKAYETLLTMLISDMRKDVGAIVGADLSSTPFVMGKITRNPDPAYTQHAFVSVVNAAQVAVTTKVNKTFIIDTGTLRQLDGWHYCADAQHWIGTQFIDTLISADGKYGINVSGVNTNMFGGGAKTEGETVTVTFVPYENCTLKSIKIKIGTSDATDIELDENNSYTFVMPAANVSFEANSIDPNTVETKYGIIPSKYADAEVYPFVLFKNGEMISAFEDWHTFINANTLTGCTLLLRRNYSTTEGGDAWGLVNNSDLTLDLDNYILTRGDYHLFQALGKGAIAHSTTLRVINGTLKAQFYKDTGDKVSTSPLIVFNNESASTVSDSFEFIFENVTFDLTEGRGIVTCYDGGSVGSNSKIVLNNCTIDRGTKTNSMTLFSLTDTDNKNNVKVIVNGGKLVADSLANLTFAKLDQPRAEGEDAPDSLSFGENKMVIELPSSYTVPSNVTFVFSEGVFCPKNPTVNESTGKSVYRMEKTDTVYGNIPADKASAEDYPFVLFKNGEAIHAFKDLKNFVDSEAYNNANYQTGCTLLLRRDFSTSELAKSNWAWSYIKDITIDLNGYTLTRGNQHLFNLIGHGKNDNITSITVINGTIKANYYKDNSTSDQVTSPITFNNDSNSESTDKFNVIFENVTFDVTSGRGVIQSANNASYKTGKTVNTVTFNSCTFLRGEKTNSMTLFGLKSDANRNDISVIVNGGKLVAGSTSAVNTINLASFSEGTPSPDSLKISGDFEVVLPLGEEVPTSEYTLTAGKYFLLKSGSDSESTTYVLESVNVLSTKYGDISTKYGSIEDYPFVLFKNGATVHAFKDWKAFVNSDAYSKADYKTGCTLLLRRDYSTSEATGDTWAWSYITDLTIDLGGHTLTRGNYHLFNLMSHKNTTNTTSLTIINGTLKANVYKDDGKTGASPVLCFNNDAGSTAVDNYIITFNNVTFDVSTGRGVVICYDNGGAGSGTNNTVTLNDCTIYRGSSTSSMTLFNLADRDSKNNINVVINGGKFEGDSLRSLTFATYNDADDGNNAPDSLKFGAGNNGEKFEIVIRTSSAAPDANTVWNTTDGAECVFVKTSENVGYVNYSLYPEVMVGYKIKTSVTLYSNFVYNIYIPKANVNSFTVNGSAMDYEEIDIDGVAYYLVRVELPAGETLSDIKLTVTLNSGDVTVDANWTLSVFKYTKSVLAGEYNDTTKILMKDMLVYASCAHTYFEKTAGVEAKLSEINTLLNGYTKELPTGEAKKPTNDTYFTNVAVYLGEVPSFRFYLAESYTDSDFTFNVGGRSVTATLGNDDDGDYLEIVMYAYMMLDDVTYTVKGTDVTESYNLFAYYAYAKTLNNDNLVAIVEGLMKYSVSAKAYRDSVVNK